MVADRIEIETRRATHKAEKVEPLRIDIPAVSQQFRVYPGSSDAAEGTTVTVHVLGRKIKKGCPGGEKPNARQNWQVTEYLRAVAGLLNSPLWWTKMVAER